MKTKTKNYLLKMLTVSIAAAICVGFSSCGDDKDDSKEDPTNKTVVFLKCPDNKHPHLIDLGLPSGTKWACCNVGADKPEAYGGYYAWGDTEEKKDYDWRTYIWWTDSNNDGRVEKREVKIFGSDIAGTEHDVAHVKWGGSWGMPSIEHIRELLNNCTYEWTTMNDVHGGQFTGPSGGTIFLPAAGSKSGDLSFAGKEGYYWSSSQDQSDSQCAYLLGFGSKIQDRNYGDRASGKSVRPIWTTQ